MAQASLNLAQTKPHLDEVCASVVFAKSLRSTALLRYLWRTALDGRSELIKEFDLGVDVFERGTEYDPKIDSIVRTEVTRLRSRLSRYYETEGAASPLRFEIPKGSYALQFVEAGTLPAATAAPIGQVALPSPPHQAPAWSKWSNAWPAVALAILLIGAIIAWRAIRPTPAAQSMRFQFGPPPGMDFDPASFAVSPDGGTLAFVAIQNGRRGLWIRPLDGNAPRMLPGTNDASQPFWSPDSQNVAYYGDRKMRRIAVSGGNPAVICDQFESLGSFWNEQGIIVFSPVAGGLKTVPAAGGIPSSLTSLDAARDEISHRWPQQLPGGKILFFAASSDPAKASVAVVELRKPAQRTQIMPSVDGALYSAGHLVWRRGTSLVAQVFDARGLRLSGDPKPIADVTTPEAPTRIMLSASEKNDVLIVGTVPFTHRLTWVDRSGKPLTVFGTARRHSVLALSPDGKRAVVPVGSAMGAFDLWRVDLDRDQWTRLTFAKGGSNNFPVWSPDGRTIAYRSGRPPNLYAQDSQERGTGQGKGTEVRIGDSKNTQWPTSWSGDGRTLMYYEQGPRGNRNIWTVAVGPDGKPNAQPRVYLTGSYNLHWGKFNPGRVPRWVAYESDESDRPEVYLRSFPSPGLKVPVSAGIGGAHPEWNADGSEIFFVSGDRHLMSVDVGIKGNSVVVGKPRELFLLPDTGSYFAPSTDGRRFLINGHGGPMGPLDVIVNWTPKIK